MKRKRGCSVEGCLSTHEAKGYCKLHYNRFWRHGTTDARQQRICTIDGCDAPHRAHGLCCKHLQRWKRHGHADDPVSKPLPKCIKCDQPAVYRSMSLCFRHYHEVWRERHRYPPCKVLDCDKPAIYAKLCVCSRHYRTFRYGVDHQA